MNRAERLTTSSFTRNHLSISLLTFGYLCLHSRSPLQGEMATEIDSIPVAIVDGMSVTDTELTNLASQQLQELEERRYQLRRAALEQRINQILLGKAAQTKMISVPALIRSRFSSVTDAEVQAAHEKNKDRLPPTTPSDCRVVFDLMNRTARTNERGEYILRNLDVERSPVITVSHSSFKPVKIDATAISWLDRTQRRKELNVQLIR